MYLLLKTKVIYAIFGNFGLVVCPYVKFFNFDVQEYSQSINGHCIVS